MNQSFTCSFLYTASQRMRSYSLVWMLGFILPKVTVDFSRQADHRLPLSIQLCPFCVIVRIKWSGLSALFPPTATFTVSDRVRVVHYTAALVSSSLVSNYLPLHSEYQQSQAPDNNLLRGMFLWVMSCLLYFCLERPTHASVIITRRPRLPHKFYLGISVSSMHSFQQVRHIAVNFNF